ncbi:MULTISPECIES: nuclease-related domain-containing protein [unclassified Flavobacterium]|uniref:nuclease-related domain-containing protein n=1 Tax=unclassified Flavobacterium TaxID=196869 RepID=UPI0009590357|nr:MULTISPECIES: nuclease-related domain-containing protein [unclassified Flavobacterium]MBN9285606.1 NERD domain-containing protein [Flavobacterium sp.]OJV71037.1 MAG: hypothetical protein BGO42_04280 [Flavobacterium sp. 40-81]
MCKTYNTIGSLTTLKSNLIQNNIHDFKSLKEVIDFQKSYSILRQQLITHHENLIEQEKKILDIDLPNLDTTIATQRQQSTERLTNEIDMLKQKLHITTNSTQKNIFHKVISSLKQRNYKRVIKHKETHFDSKVNAAVSQLITNYQVKTNRYQFITAHFNDAVKQSAQNSLYELERKKSVIGALNNYIYGALGEQKVVKTLESLSDDYFLINDFSVTFSPAIYNRRENEYIKSVQIDHILVSPSGIFIIETKNWSEKSLENLSLRSPVDQIKRANFVLFYLLNNEKSNYHLHLNSHHWGDKKIPIKNLIVLINTKPQEEFQYVKIVTVNELLNYVNHFKPIFSSAETKRIAEMILRING